MIPIQYLTKPMIAEGTAAAVEHHAIARVELAANLATMMVMLEQWPAEQARINGATPSGYWQVQLDVASLDLKAGLAVAVREAIVSAAPFLGGVWSKTSEGSVHSAKQRKRASLRAERERRLQKTFTSGGRVFDLRHGSNLSAAVLDAVIAQNRGEDFSQFWVLANDTSTQLTAAETIAAGRAAKQIITGLWQISQALREQVDAIDDETGTLQDVAAVVWPE